MTPSDDHPVDSPEPIIRPAREPDYEAIVSLWSASGLFTRPNGRDSRGQYERQLRRFPGTYLIAEVDGRVLGVVLGTHDERKGWINRLAVHPDCRRRGMAQRLLGACERALLDEGIEIFSALVETDNAGSTATFDGCGYKRDIPVHYFHKRLRGDV